MMENKSSKYLIPMAFAICLASGVWIGAKFLSSGSNAPNEQRYGKMKDIIEILNNKYVDSLDGDKLFEQAISDMLHKLDPHSAYISADDLKAATEQIEGHFGGVGVRFSVIRDTVCISSVIPNSPSERVGIKAGDRIIQVDKTNIAGVNIKNDKIMKMLKGTQGTPVDVVIYRDKAKLNKTIIRNTIPIESIVCAAMLTPNVGYIKLDQFSVESGREFKLAASKLQSKGMTKLIFDLRNNGGGVLQSAVQIVDEFLEAGDVIVTTEGRNVRKEVYKATSKGMLINTEVVVLVNERSASASEIVAGALQDNDRATIVGRRSFGKGLVQQDIVLKDGSDLRLVVARYYTPTGRCIQKPYEEGYEEYYEEQFEHKELYEPDSTLLVDSLKYTTPKGKTVYGGGGIMPDVFIPLDTLGASWYFTQLRYSPAFQNFAFDFVSDKRQKWKDRVDFKKNFQVTDAILNQFLNYAEKNHKVEKNVVDLNTSKTIIKNALKGEISRQLWTEQGYYYVTSDSDNEIQRALKILK
jgi:carboxyl-terminal processing protease